MVKSGVARWLGFVLVAVSTVFPLTLLAVMSFSREWFYPELVPSEWTAANWSLLVTGRTVLSSALFTSVALAASAGFIAAMIGLPAGREIAALTGWPRRSAVALVFLPVALPPLAVAVGLDYSLLLGGLGGSFTGVLLAHVVPALGYTTLFFIGIFAVFDRRVEEEARSLGASPREVLWKVTIPILRRPLLEAFALAFLVSWAQVPLTLLIGQGIVRTLPLELMAYVGAGQDHLAATVGLVLAIPPLILLGAVGFASRKIPVVIA